MEFHFGCVLSNFAREVFHPISINCKTHNRNLARMSLALKILSRARFARLIQPYQHRLFPLFYERGFSVFYSSLLSILEIEVQAKNFCLNAHNKFMNTRSKEQNFSLGHSLSIGIPRTYRHHMKKEIDKRFLCLDTHKKKE